MNKNITLASFEETIKNLLAAKARNSSKGKPMIKWFKDSFGIDARVAHITEDKQCGNRIKEQFSYKHPVVVFICNNQVNLETLIRFIEQQTYSELEVVLIATVSPGPAFSYQHLYVHNENDFSSWAEQTLSITSEEMAWRASATSTIYQSSPAQVIYYGAPGTGKSFSLNQDTKGAEVIRTTFHPDSDYSSFVGGYKPVEISVQKTYIAYDSATKKAIEIPVYDMKSNTEAQERKITYKFVQQAFLKAYIRAWKKISRINPQSASSAEKGLDITYSGNKATITIVAVDNQQLTLRKIEKFSKKIVESSWNKLWRSGVFQYPHGSRPGTSIQDAVAIWIYENGSNVKTAFSVGWDSLLDCCRQNKTVDTKPGSQTYTISSMDGVQDSVIITSFQPKKKENVREMFSGSKKPRGIEKGIIEKLKEYNQRDFNDAWKKLVEAVSQKPVSNPTSEQSSTDNTLYLIIEEINRGDCAQVFGDIFQLLDRNEKGFSSYPIEADSDIQRELKNEFEQFIIPQEIDLLYLDQAGKPLYYSWEDNGKQWRGTTSEAIKEGRILVIPSNLFIYASMNTSDQSLFPMDSAFKRRWEWRYFPIKDGKKDFKILIDGAHQYDWWKTIEILNKKIYNVSKSADKQLGYWFAKAKDGSTTIDAKVFVSKVIFYLWNDVFKDYGFDSNNAFSQSLQFGDFFTIDGDINIQTIIEFMSKNGIENEKNQTQAPANIITSNNQQP